MSAWLNDLSDGQFSVLAVAVIALVFVPAFYGVGGLLRRFGRRAVPFLLAAVVACVAGITGLATLLVRLA